MLFEGEKRQFPVAMAKEVMLLVKMAKLGIHEDKIMERFVRASGPGR